MMDKPRARRSRDGCWSCKQRRKKCDSKVFPCGNCKRLGLECSSDTRLVWEDDARRNGMRRRGPKTRISIKEKDTTENARFSQDGDGDGDVPGWEIVGLRRISEWPFDLDETEYQLLSHYMQRFSRVYPAFGGPTNPFIRIFLPLSMQSRPILDALLALSSVQSWESGSFFMEAQMLKLRHQALRGCNELLSRVMGSPTAVDKAGNDMIHLLATCGLLLLYEKLSGGESGDNGTAHLQFFARLFPAHKLLHLSPPQDVGQSQWNEAIRFLSSLFLYNDIVRSTSFRTPTLLTFYDAHTLGEPRGTDTSAQPISLSPPDLGRFEFPSIIARISNGDLSVTDTDIAAWDGRLDWFPSFALLPAEKVDAHEMLPTADPAFVHDPSYSQLATFTTPESWAERVIISELYRIAGTVYRKQCILRMQFAFGDVATTEDVDVQMGNLPQWAIELVALLPADSLFQNTLLWPTAIVARELSTQDDREYITERLRSLEQRFKMRHFYLVREHLARCWKTRDSGLIHEEEQPVLFG